MINRILLLALFLNLTHLIQAQHVNLKVKPAVSSPSNLEVDKSYIKKMCGIYKVTFDFAETFATDSGYKYYPRYKEWGIEYVFVAEESPRKIVLQHLLIANDSIIIKHWAQEWVYENTKIYSYYRDNEWIQKTITTEQAKGTWTQKVYQVDDSPRYESYGTWVHVDGKHYWEGSTFAPLPRREYTKRSDYNVMGRNSRMEIYDNGWALVQENQKIDRKNGIDKTLCWEKGIERFWSGNYNATPAIKWWNKQQNYWADVRKVWDEVYVKYPTLKIKSSVNNQRLFDVLFELGDKVCKDNDYTQGKAKAEIDTLIKSFITAS